VTNEEHEFEMTVIAVFTITGRGLVACGIPRGAIRLGDVVRVIHGSDEFLATCRGVEMIRSEGIDLHTIGLDLPELTREQVAEGDLITLERRGQPA
jgi:translation elongation factor EF-Tu-like GTPase